MRTLLLFFSLLVAAPVWAGAIGSNCENLALEAGGFKKEKFLNDPKAMAAEGDFIHHIWQTSNSYKTRYKAMKDAKGNPVTDITAYIAEHNIPAEFRGYYQQTTKGNYEEDIKKIPNQWLASNNSKENSDGAKSYLENLRKITSKQPISTLHAKSLVFEGLRNIHREWYERNSSWTVPYGEPKTFDEANIEAQYNGALQFYKIAERHGVLKDYAWAVGFDAVMQDLVQKKFAPYASMSVVEAYLAMTHKVGTRPAIGGDAHINQFFDNHFTQYDFVMPSDRQQEPQAIHSFLNHILPAQNYVISQPSIAPGSTARVYLIFDQPSKAGATRGAPVAVLKIQAGAQGLDEVVSTMAAAKEITSSDNLTPVKTLLFGRFKGGDYFLIQEVAKNYEADRVFGQNQSTRFDMVHKVAAALATMHGLVREFIVDKEKGINQVKEVSADLTTFRGNGFYDVRQTRNFLTANKGSIGFELEQGVSANMQDYSRILELTPEILSPTVIHGDFHGGNIFLNDENVKANLIDYSGATWFIGKKIGTGDRGNDVGRMVGNIIVESTRRGLDFNKEIAPAIASLLSEYKRQAHILPNSPQEAAFITSVQFYMNRFIGVNATDLNGKKFKPLNGESLASLHERLKANWILAVKGMNQNFGKNHFLSNH
jgi:aminoglycoside phosphotransferase (APT) family kinase protein